MGVKCVLLAALTLIAVAAAITTTEEREVGDACQTLINSDRTFVPGFVRLAFHDSVGGSDGCVNVELFDERTRDFPNIGLATYITALEQAYDGITRRFHISRADFWMKCAHEALLSARRNAGEDHPVAIDMNYGRTDCDSVSDDGFTDSTSNAGKFPNPRLGLSHVLQWCNETFNFTKKECTAIMGAHTLGRASRDASGYVGPWVRGRQDVLNNDYYQLLNDPQLWTQRDVNRLMNPDEEHARRWQYETSGGRNRRIMMLNTDMCLKKDIMPDPESGKVVELLTATENSETTADLIDEYAKNDTRWIIDFGRVFTKMIEHTHANLLAASQDEGPVPNPGPRPPPAPGPGRRNRGGRRSGNGRGNGRRQG